MSDIASYYFNSSSSRKSKCIPYANAPLKNSKTVFLTKLPKCSLDRILCRHCN